MWSVGVGVQAVGFTGLMGLIEFVGFVGFMGLMGLYSPKLRPKTLNPKT